MWVTSILIINLSWSQRSPIVTNKWSHICWSELRLNILVLLKVGKSSSVVKILIARMT